MGASAIFPTGTYAGIGTTCVEFENVMKSAMKKKSFQNQNPVKMNAKHGIR